MPIFCRAPKMKTVLNKNLSNWKETITNCMLLRFLLSKFFTLQLIWLKKFTNFLNVFFFKLLPDKSLINNIKNATKNNWLVNNNWYTHVEYKPMLPMSFLLCLYKRWEAICKQMVERPHQCLPWRMQRTSVNRLRKS